MRLIAVTSSWSPEFPGTDSRAPQDFVLGKQLRNVDEWVGRWMTGNETHTVYAKCAIPLSSPSHTGLLRLLEHELCEDGNKTVRVSSQNGLLVNDDGSTEKIYKK